MRPNHGRLAVPDLSGEMSTIVDGRQPTTFVASRPTSKTKCVVLEAVMMREGEHAGEYTNDTCDLSATAYTAQASNLDEEKPQNQTNSRLHISVTKIDS